MSTDRQKNRERGPQPSRASIESGSVYAGFGGWRSGGGEIAPPSTGLFDKLRSEMSIRGPVRWRGFAGPRVHAGNVKEA